MIGGFRQWEDPNDPRRNRGPAPQEQNVPGLPAVRRLMSGTTGSGYGVDIQNREQEVQDELKRIKVREAVGNIRSENPFQDLIRGDDAERVFSELLGKPVSPTVARRAKDFIGALPELTPEQAVYLADEDIQGRGNRRGAQLDKRVTDKIAQMGEIRRDPLNKFLASLAISGVIDPEKRAESQIRANTKENIARETVERLRADEMRQLNVSEQELENALSRVGRKLIDGRRNPLQKETKGGVDLEKFLVPALLGEAGEEYKGKRQPKTYQSAPGQRRFDARGINLGLLDPTALMPVDLGYLRTELESSYANPDATGNIPAIDRASAEITDFDNRRYTAGVRDIDDPSAQPRNRQMTLGEAVEDILYRNRTPLAEIPINELRRDPDNKNQILHKRQDGSFVKVFPLGNVEDIKKRGSGTFRIGENRQVKTEGFIEFGNLIEALTGQRLIPNEPLSRFDRELGDITGRTLDASIAGKRTGSATYDIMQALAAGARLPAQVTESSALVANAPELDFYNKQLGIEDSLDQLRAQAAAADDMASNIPQAGASNSTKVSMVNAPESPPVNYSPEIAGQIPEAARGNIESGMEMPAGSPRRKAAEEFLRSFMNRRRG
jgi:cell division septum initiation protein DivIVA